MKSWFSRSWLPFFRMFTFYFKFDRLIIFSHENPPRKLKILNFFFLSSFSARFFKCYDCACSFLKSGGIFCPPGNFNWMENDLSAWNFIKKEILAQVFFCEFCEIFKNTFSVCNFQSTKTPVKLNSLLSRFFCYITLFVISPD